MKVLLAADSERTRVLKQCSRSGLRRHWAGFKPAASAFGLRERDENGPHGRIRTRTGLLLRQLPLHWATWGNESGAPGRVLACNLRVRSAARYSLCHGSKKWKDGRPGPLRACRAAVDVVKRRKTPLGFQSRNATLAIVRVCVSVFMWTRCQQWSVIVLWSGWRTAPRA